MPHVDHVERDCELPDSNITLCCGLVYTKQDVPDLPECQLLLQGPSSGAPPPSPTLAANLNGFHACLQKTHRRRAASGQVVPPDDAVESDASSRVSLWFRELLSDYNVEMPRKPSLFTCPSREPSPVTRHRRLSTGRRNTGRQNRTAAWQAGALPVRSSRRSGWMVGHPPKGRLPHRRSEPLAQRRSSGGN
jgi:hypothetical protein